MTLGSHQKTVGGSQSWITPKWIIDELGPFDLDPCASDPQPWPCAAVSYTQQGLALPWRSRVWLNPPFDRYDVGRWIDRLSRHQHGTALLHVRSETAWFMAVWNYASAILLLSDRLHFHYPDGRRAEANSGAPACLVAFGAYDAQRLKACDIPGVLLEDWEMKGGKPKKMPFNRGQQGKAPGGTPTKSPKSKSTSGGKGRGPKGR